MNILIVSFSVNFSMGDNFKCISRYLSKDNDVFVLTNSGVTPEMVGTDNVCNVRFNKHKPLDFFNPVSYLDIARYLKKIDYDIAFVCSPHPVNLFVYCLLDMKRTVCYVHDHIPHSGVKILDKWSIKGNLYWSYNKVAKIIVSCESIKRDILREKYMDDANKIEVCHLGLLDNLIYDFTEKIPDIDILFFGRIEYYKGLDILVKVAKSLPHVRFTIAGQGDLESVFGIKELPANCVHINRYVPDEELAHLIYSCKAVVLPYRDATGTQTIQSVFYYSKPIIATRVGCFPEYISDGIDGRIVEPENVEQLKSAIEDLLGDNTKCAEFGTNGNKKLNTMFSNEEINKRYLEIFKSVIDN